jgi:hypothetical protein
MGFVDYVEGHLGRWAPKIPVNFPVIREIDPETSSLRTAPTTIAGM